MLLFSILLCVRLFEIFSYTISFLIYFCVYHDFYLLLHDCLDKRNMFISVLYIQKYNNLLLHIWLIYISYFYSVVLCNQTLNIRSVGWLDLCTILTSKCNKNTQTSLAITFFLNKYHWTSFYIYTAHIQIVDYCLTIFLISCFWFLLARHFLCFNIF